MANTLSDDKSNSLPFPKVEAPNGNSPAIDLDVEAWKPPVLSKIREYDETPNELVCQKFRVACDYDYFAPKFQHSNLPTAK